MKVQKINPELNSLIASRSKELDYGRHYSFGKKMKNFIGEEVTGVHLGWLIENSSDDDVSIAIAVSGAPTQFENAEAIKAALGVQAIFGNGKIYDATGGKEVNVSSTISGRKINEFLRYAGFSPVRFTKWQLASFTTAGAPETTNFQGHIKGVWVSPFDSPVENLLSLRSLQNQYVTSGQYGEVDFLRQNFQAILSQEHFLIITVRKGTALNITAHVGAQDSKAQRFYRDVKKADETMRTINLHA
jgi:hypothetical protein